MIRRAVAAVTTAIVVGGCSGPTTPPPPPDPGPATAPVIRSISVPATRVEAAQDIAITAVVEDAETPLTQLTYAWTASAGTITGQGTSATWRMAAGITSGQDVTVTLTVTDQYERLVNGVLIRSQFVVSQTSAAFRVHDSRAELVHLSQRFLRDLFGNSSVRPADCLVDFAELCADLPFGKKAELADITEHRTLVEVVRVTFFSQIVSFQGADAGRVYSDTEFLDRWLSDGIVRAYRNEFVVTARYHDRRWWICESFVDRTNDVRRDGWMTADGRGRIGARIK